MIGVRSIVLMLAVACVAGCGFGRYLVLDPERDRVLRVESGDRFYFSLDESEPDSGKWLAATDDSDVEILVDHEDGKAKVRIRIHRGYDGPSVLTFRRRRPGAPEPEKEFQITLYRHTGDSAFWK